MADSKKSSRPINSGSERASEEEISDALAAVALVLIAVMALTVWLSGF